MALPWLESLSALAAEPVVSASGAMAGAFPKRLGVIFMGNGISPPHWWANGTGAEKWNWAARWKCSRR